MRKVHRRQFLLATGALLAAPLVRARRPENIYRIGWPSILPRDSVERWNTAFEDGLRDHGYLPARTS